MNHLFSKEARRDPYALYERARHFSPVLHDAISGYWMIFDHESVKRVLSDYETFSSHYGPPWMIFLDPPRHSKLRALVARAFTPRSIAGLETRIRELTRELLREPLAHGEIDLAGVLAIPLPMMVIAEMLGIPPADRKRFARWVDVMLDMSQAIAGGGQAAGTANAAFTTVSAEMGAYLDELLAARHQRPSDDLLTRLLQAEVNGEHLTETEILGFFQLLLLGGSETILELDHRI